MRARFFHEYRGRLWQEGFMFITDRRTRARKISSRSKIDRRTNNAFLVEQRTLPRVKCALSRSGAAWYEDKSDWLRKEWEWKTPALRDRWSFVCMHPYAQGMKIVLSYDSTSLSSFLRAIILFQSPNENCTKFFYFIAINITSNYYT